MRLGLMPFTLMPFWRLEDGCGVPHMHSVGQPCLLTGGYVFEFWEVLSAELGGKGSYLADWGALANAEKPIGPQMFPCLATRACDAVLLDYADLGNYQQPAEQINGYIFTAPFWFDAWTGIVLQERREADSMLSALQPFAGSLWGAAAIFIAACALLIALHAAHDPAAQRPRSLREVPTLLSHSLYHATTACLGDTSYVERVWGARFTRLGVMVVVLVLHATYTANLVASLTRPLFVQRGPKSMDELKGAVACVALPSFAHFATPHVREVITPSDPCNDPTSNCTDFDRRAWCHERLREGTADVWLELESIARPIVLRHCARASESESLALVPALRFGPASLGFALRAENASLANHLSVAAIHKTQHAPLEYLNLGQKYLGAGESCPPVVRAELGRIEFSALAGVFAVFGIVAAVGLLLTAVRRAVVQRAGTTGSAPAVEAMTEIGMLQAVLGRLRTAEEQLQRLEALREVDVAVDGSTT